MGSFVFLGIVMLSCDRQEGLVGFALVTPSTCQHEVSHTVKHTEQ